MLINKILALSFCSLWFFLAIIYVISFCLIFRNIRFLFPTLFLLEIQICPSSAITRL